MKTTRSLIFLKKYKIKDINDIFKILNAILKNPLIVSNKSGIKNLL